MELAKSKVCSLAPDPPGSSAPSPVEPRSWNALQHRWGCPWVPWQQWAAYAVPVTPTSAGLRPESGRTTSEHTPRPPSPLMSFSDQRRSSQLTLMLHVHHLGQPTPFACPSTRHVTLEGQETG